MTATEFRSATTAGVRSALAAGADHLHLPGPPTDEEKWVYLGPQWRWVAPLSFVGYLLIVVSVSFFVYQHSWAALLLVPLGITTVGTLVSLYTSSRPRRDSRESHAAVVEAWSNRRRGRGAATYLVQPPSVDVFLPSAGEPLEVLRNTYANVAQLDWDGELNVYVLDDSGRKAVRDLAHEYGLTYLTRPDRGYFKKAGNLRYGFEHSRGELIFVLDADFVPRPDALRNLAPYFEESDVAIVQSPQFFDVSASMNWLQRAAGATQVLFYRWVQPSRDRNDAAICVGTSAMYRRAALVESGGFALIGHSEDVHTGVNLMKVGYRVRYVPVVLTKGLCPDTLEQFFTQQYRWCTGSMSLLFSKPFHQAELTFRQRLSYWSGFLYYITTALNVFVMAVPALLMVWFVPDAVTPANYVFVLLAMVIRQSVIPFITLQSESMIGLTRIQMTYSFSHAVALVDVLRKRTDAWVATGTTAKSRTSVRVGRLVRVWCISVQLLMWVGIAIHAPQYGFLTWSLMIALTLLNAYVVYPIVLNRPDVALLRDVPRLVTRRWRAAGLRPAVSATDVALSATRQETLS